ncbi:RagB/SusD family nutrient uptake outer membrane protein [Mucilaginibacter sp. SMC90]|uniref:RagB/SusD family nutrient uptake outer membrane protein n=1 Tax=Mucilaginibacter sp. SMC90 TaxID=2929803 RepID=UPI001FB48C64|nr:RagB/SusD family nutrient uptake outer membrane protein [Mucilaginibacter sp. SMC90]UOE47851.1 RagB/SusD family nutrient uptake outer membrane protein [Mucilaginibacter sp. SMC90]
MKTRNNFCHCRQDRNNHHYSNCFLKLFVLSLMFILNSCKKQDTFLSAKTNAALAVPLTLDDYQSLLQNQGVFNIKDPGLGEIATDDFYVTTPVWSSLATTQEIKGYIWDKVVYDAGANISDWSNPYKQVYYANTVINALPKLTIGASDQEKYNVVKGNALFYRAVAFYNLLQIFATPYDKKTAGTDLGIPLRLNSDLKVRSTRSTIQQCYNQILGDLKTALPLLPEQAAVITSASQLAVEGYLARIYLAINDYENALKYADECLKSYGGLTDFNDLAPLKSGLSSTFLAEDIFHATFAGYGIISPNLRSITDSTLYASYDPDDLRKSLFFNLKSGLPYFKGTYDFKGNQYSGIANDEIYLIRAECLARAGDTEGALADLNSLLSKRWIKGSFVPVKAADSNEALSEILKERRKELLYRGLRWTDLRRLNKDPNYAVTLFRNVNGNKYTLEPNSPRYAWPIPDNEIQVNNLPQNPR